MESEKIKKFVDIIRLYNNEPSKRVFRVDRDCYVVFTGFSAIDERPFIRIGYSDYVEKFKKHISNVVITAGYLSSIEDEIEQIKNDEFDTNFIVPSSIYNVILKFLPTSLHHKVNVNVIDKGGQEEDLGKVLKEIGEKYKSYVLLYDNGNFAVTFSGKKIFDLFSVITNDLTISKILNLLSSKLYDILPNNSIIKVGGNYVIRTKKGEILISTDEFSEKEFLKTPIPITTVKTIIGNDVISLIDTIRLVYDRTKLRVFTNKDTYEDFKYFSLGIKFVEISDKINVINNVNISSEDNKYYIPLVDKDGNERQLIFSKSYSSRFKSMIKLNNLEYISLEDFSRSSLVYFSTDLLLRDPEEEGFKEKFDEIRNWIKDRFNKRVSLGDIERDFDVDNSKIINDRRRLEELIDLYERVYELPYSERIGLLVKSEKLEGTEKEKEIKEIAHKISTESRGIRVEEKVGYSSPYYQKTTYGKKEFKPVSSRLSIKGINIKYLIVGLGVLLFLLLGGIFWFFRDSVFNRPLTEEEQRVSQIISKLEDTYEPELTKIQNELGITITDYDIWVYVNKVAVVNGYKPLTYKKPKKWEDPDWVYPGNKLKLLDDSYIIVRKGDNMWNISKRKIIEDYIKKNFIVTVKSKAGTNVYKVEKRK